MVVGDFKVGDVVSCKAGGPRMTISEIATYLNKSYPQAKCHWFSGERSESLEEGFFRLEELDMSEAVD